MPVDFGFRKRGRALAERLAAPFRLRAGRLVGVHPAGDRLGVARIYAEGGDWVLAGATELALPPASDDGADSPWAEAVAHYLAEEDWSSAAVSLSLPISRVFAATMDFPALPAAEMKRAAHWEIVGREVFPDDDFHVVCLPYGEDTLTWWVAALSVREEEEIRATWRARDLELWCLSAAPTAEAHLEDGDRLFVAGQTVYRGKSGEIAWTDATERALHAAVLPTLRENALASFFSRDADSPWNWRKMAKCTAAGFAVAASLLLSCDFYALHAREKALAREEAALALLVPDRRRMEAIEESRRIIADRERHLVRLSRENFPWRSLLVHLGTLSVDGVWLDEIAPAEADTLLLQGRATEFSTLAEFVRKFEEDEDFFPAGPVLEDARRDDGDGGTIRFSLKLRLAP